LLQLRNADFCFLYILLAHVFVMPCTSFSAQYFATGGLTFNAQTDHAVVFVDSPASSDSERITHLT
jgi:hypothetical protein